MSAFEKMSAVSYICLLFTRAYCTGFMFIGEGKQEKSVRSYFQVIRSISDILSIIFYYIINKSDIRKNGDILWSRL